MERKGDKVAIVGMSNTTMGQATRLFGAKDFEVWGLNQLYLTLPKVVKYATRWFQIHEADAQVDRDYRLMTYLDSFGFPIYMRKKYDHIVNSVAYPKQEIVEEFGTYFTNQVSWMLALAIYEGFKEIHLYGVDMVIGMEYGHQRPSCEYFIGLARGRGINVVIPRGSDLLKTMRLYGFEDCSEIHDKITVDIQRHQQSIRNDKHAIMKARDERMKLIGALDGRIDDEKKREFAEKRVAELNEKEQNLRGNVNYMNGMIDMLDYFDRNWGQNL